MAQKLKIHKTIKIQGMKSTHEKFLKIILKTGHLLRFEKILYTNCQTIYKKVCPLYYT